MVLAGGGGLNVLRTAGQLGLLHLGQGRTVMTGLVTWRPGAKVSCLAGEASYILLVTFQYTDSLVRHGQLQGGHGGETVPGPAIVGPQGGAVTLAVLGPRHTVTAGEVRSLTGGEESAD